MWQHVLQRTQDTWQHFLQHTHYFLLLSMLLLFLALVVAVVMSPTLFIVHAAKWPCVVSSTDDSVAKFFSVLCGFLISLVIWETLIRFVTPDASPRLKIIPVAVSHPILTVWRSFTQFAYQNLGRPYGMIYWDRLPALLSLIVLVVRFAHGNDRYFDLALALSKNTAHKYQWLCFDTVYFFILYILFFLMTRALPAMKWTRFYGYLGFIVSFDILWDYVTFTWRGVRWVEPWLIIDLASLSFVLSLIVFGLIGFERKPVTMSWVGLTIITAITVFDYYQNWDLYFPSVICSISESGEVRIE